MKVRKGFVSNSSTTTFICDVCGNVEAGMDISISECEMRECVNGHTFCIKHDTGKISIDGMRRAVENASKWTVDDETKEEVRNMTDEEVEEWFENEGEDAFYDIMNYEYPAEWCPLCNFRALARTDIISYLMKKHGLTAEGLATEMQGAFNDYETFQQYLSNQVIAEARDLTDDAVVDRLGVDE
jgi:hypothetical protein